MSKWGLLLSSEKHARKQANTQVLQQISLPTSLSQIIDGFIEETLQKLDRKTSAFGMKKAIWR